MPRNVRNFWIEGSVDGRASAFASGPRNKDGGFSQTIYCRNNGDVEKVLFLRGRVLSDGTLILEIDGPNGPLFEWRGKR